MQDYALRRAKVRTKKQRKADMNIIFQAFTDQAQRTQQIDRFMLSLILYFRYYLKHYKASRAAKDNHAKWAEGYLQALQASSRDQKFVNQFASNSNLAAAYSQTEIDGSAVVDDEADDGQIVQITLGYLQRNMENLMIIAGMSYMDILATRTDPTLPESWKEAYFNVWK
jgi:hypothetical protein